MKVEMLGHANVLISSPHGAVLFDPLFYGVHHEGVYDIYPPRSFDLQALGHFDAVVVSHAHADHFDPASLALLPRGVPLIVPSDTEMIACLRGLGFQHLIRAQDFEPIRLGSMELIPTPAAAGALEHGFVLRDEEATVWNMVDTFPSPAAIEQVLERFGPIAALLAPWQPLHDTAVSTGAVPVFPHGMYSAILTTIARINARVVIPGACGFWAVNAAAWTNKLLFPLTRERFIRDLERLDSILAKRVQPLEPGDAVTVTPRGVALDRGLAACVSLEQPYDWRDRAFDPLSLLGPPLREHRGPAASVLECGEAIADFFKKAMPEFVADYERAFVWHRLWEPVYQVEVVFDEGQRRYYTMSFEGGALEVSEGLDPLRTAFVAVTAGLLVGLIAGSLSWDYAMMSGEMRRFSFNYGVDERGLRVPHSVGLHDPLTMMLGAASERENFMANLIEALDENYRQTLREDGREPEQALVQARDAPAIKAVPTFDPTRIAESVMQQVNMAFHKQQQLEVAQPTEESNQDEKHDAS